MNIPDSHGMSKKDYFEAMGHSWEEVEQILRLDRIYKSRVNNREDVHHLIAQVKHGSNHPFNLKTMLRGEHVAHHDVFGVLKPAEQIMKIVKFNKPVFIPEIPKKIEEILIGSKTREIYKREVFS